MKAYIVKINGEITPFVYKSIRLACLTNGINYYKVVRGELEGKSKGKQYELIPVAIVSSPPRNVKGGKGNLRSYASGKSGAIYP